MGAPSQAVSAWARTSESEQLAALLGTTYDVYAHVGPAWTTLRAFVGPRADARSWYSLFPERAVGGLLDAPRFTLAYVADEGAEIRELGAASTLEEAARIILSDAREAAQ